MWNDGLGKDSIRFLRSLITVEVSTAPTAVMRWEINDA
jgi:hypothetical protein